MTDFYSATGAPSTGSSGSSAVVRSEYTAIAAAFAKLAGYTGNGGLPLFVNAGGTAYEAANVATAQSRLGIIFSNELNGLANLNAVGIVARTGNGAYTNRTLTGTANQVTVTNGNGGAGNPTLSFPSPMNTPGDVGVGGNQNVTGTLAVAGNSSLNNLNATQVGVTSLSATGNVSAGNVNVVGALRGTSAMLSPLNNSLAADVNLNNTSLYFDGPSVAQGNNGTWFASGTVTMVNVNPNAVMSLAAKLWDGATVIDATQTTCYSGAQPVASISLSGLITSPSGNIRISVKDGLNTTSKITNNFIGFGKDSTITAIRIG
jgi:hypothetical protein